jgi:hypothetical protein
MVLKNVFTAVICAGFVTWVGPATADEYRPDDFLSLDLSKALLSPQPLGPPSKFMHVPVEARADRATDVTRPRAEANVVKTKRIALPRTEVAHLRSEKKPRGAARTRLAHRHGNPLNAQAFDTRIQVWPCRSSDGGICEWKR